MWPGRFLNPVTNLGSLPLFSGFIEKSSEFVYEFRFVQQLDAILFGYRSDMNSTSDCRDSVAEPRHSCLH